MPVYLVFLQVAKKDLQFAQFGLNLSALLEACNRNQTAKKFFFEVVFAIVKIFTQSQLLENFHVHVRRRLSDQ